MYTKCDEVLDQYDVYKVETIGDAYMVVSGLPKMNGGKHSDQICTMALNLFMVIETVRMSHQPDQCLLMRIGVHTGSGLNSQSFYVGFVSKLGIFSGSCAAGVVGLKMPR